MKPSIRSTVTFTGKEQAELLSEPLDGTPLKDSEVAGPTLYSLISAGTELSWGYRGNKFPATPGYAAVFCIEEVGAGVDRFANGDLAFCTGTHTSYQRRNAAEALRVPDGLAPQKAVFARLMGVSMSTLTTTAARPPGKVIVAGLGPVGHLAAKIFAASGYEVLACDPAPERQALARAGGIRRVEAQMPLHDPAWAGETSLVVECSGHEASVLDACRMVRKGGEVVLIGVPWTRRTELSAHELLNLIFHRYVILRSGWEWELPLHAQDFRRNSIWGNLKSALHWLHEGRVHVEALATLHPPQDCQTVYQNLLHSKAERLAAVFDWTGE